MRRKWKRIAAELPPSDAVPKKAQPARAALFCFRRASEGGQASFVLLFLHLRLPSQAFGLAPADLFGRDALDFRQLLLRQFHCPALFACTKPLFAQMTVVEALLGRLVVVFVNRSEEIGNSLGHVQIVGDPQDDLRGDNGCIHIQGCRCTCCPCRARDTILFDSLPVPFAVCAGGCRSGRGRH